MSTEHKFLITYGLHNFVTFSHPTGQRTFTIQGLENQKMIGHVRSLIQGNYGESVRIHVT